jgi:hypothetical protein
MLYRPHAKVDDIWGCSRLVTLPDFQGLGLALALIDTLGAAYRAIGKRVHTYPAHPALIRSFDRSKVWALKQRPGGIGSKGGSGILARRLGGRPCAVFEYAGPALADVDSARALITGATSSTPGRVDPSTRTSSTRTGRRPGTPVPPPGSPVRRDVRTGRPAGHPDGSTRRNPQKP